MTDLPLTGACLCGGVRFEVSEPLVKAVYCHCERCQRRTGCAAAASARVVPGSFHIVEGAELIREWVPDGGNIKAFCSACGSGIYSRRPGDTPVAAVRMGVFDGDPGVRPQLHQFVAYAACWEDIPDDGLPRQAE